MCRKLVMAFALLFFILVGGCSKEGSVEGDTGDDVSPEDTPNYLFGDKKPNAENRIITRSDANDNKKPRYLFGSKDSNSSPEYENDENNTLEKENLRFLEARQQGDKNSRNGLGIGQINDQIAIASMQSSPKVTVQREEYTLGGGDVVEVSVFQVEDLSRTVRVSNDGYIMLPLLGTMRVEGLTADQFAQLVTKKLEADFMHNPQVSAFVTEFRSHQIAVMGAVQNPDIYSITEPRTILQMIALAGGLTPEAGDRIFVRTKQLSEENELLDESLIISLNSLIEENDALDFALQKGDSILVPKGGTVFVEGAVDKPGAYPITGEMNILKALAVAGGLNFEAQKSNIQVFRETVDGQPAVYTTSLDEIRGKQDDVQLMDGDIIVIQNSAVKQVWGGFWDGVKGIFGVNTTIR